MRKYKHEPGAKQIDRNLGSSTGSALSEEGTARRSFLGSIGRWSAAFAVSGLGLETAFQVLSKRSLISTALAVEPPRSLPPIPADQSPPPPPVPTGTIYWVATNGNDSNSGTEGSPFLTLSRAVTACGPNDGIYIKAGTYVMGGLTIKKGKIIIRGAPGTTREQVILTRPSGSGGQTHLLSLGTNVAGGEAPQEDVQIYGLTLQGGPAIPDPEYQNSHPGRIEHWANEGIRCIGYLRNSKFINCVFRHNRNRGWFGGFSSDEALKVTNMIHNIEIAYCHFYYQGVDSAGGGINFTQGGGYFHIHHNEFESDRDAVVTQDAFVGALIEFNHMNGRGMSREDAVDLKEMWRPNPFLPASTRTVVRNNIMHGFPRQTAVTIQQFSERVDIYSNKIYDSFYGIWLVNNSGKGSSRAGWETNDINILDNEIYGCGTAIGSVSVSRGDTTGLMQGAYDVVIENNKIHGNGGSEWSDRNWGQHGLRVTAGDRFKITNNVFSDNARGGHFAQMTVSGNVISASDYNAFYLPDYRFAPVRLSGTNYSLAGWQSASGHDRNSEQVSGRYDAPVAPEAPAAINVTGACSFGDTA